MSEGIQAKKAREKQEPTKSSEQQQQQAQRGGVVEAASLTTPQGPRARLSTALVEVYERVIRKPNSRGENSDSVFVAFIRNLVSRIWKFLCHFYRHLPVSSESSHHNSPRLAFCPLSFAGQLTAARGRG